MNPAGKVPVLIDGDFVLTESVAIALYLAEKYPAKGFLPHDARSKADVHRWLLEKRLAAEVPTARQDFLDMARVMEKHLDGREFLVSERATVADFVAAYTLDWANEVHLLDDLPVLRSYMERMYARPKAPQRIAEAFASLRR